MATKKSEVFPRMCFLEEVVYVCVFFWGGHPFEVWSQKKWFTRFSRRKIFLSRNGPRFEVFWDDQRMVRLELVIQLLNRTCSIQLCRVPIQPSNSPSRMVLFVFHMLFFFSGREVLIKKHHWMFFFQLDDKKMIEKKSQFWGVLLVNFKTCRRVPCLWSFAYVCCEEPAKICESGENFILVGISCASVGRSVTSLGYSWFLSSCSWLFMGYIISCIVKS